MQAIMMTCIIITLILGLLMSESAKWCGGVPKKTGLIYVGLLLIEVLIWRVI